MDYDAFIDFSDLDLDDYIHDLSWDIRARSLPLSRHTSGDLRLFVSNKYSEIFPRVFKMDGYKIVAGENIARNIQSNNSITENIISQSNETVVNNSSNNSVSNNFSETIINEVVESDVVNEHIDVKIDNKVTNITDVLNQQIQQSNSLTIEQIVELEKNLNVINNNFVNHSELRIIQERSVEQAENVKKELKQELDIQKDFFTKFLNS